MAYAQGMGRSSILLISLLLSIDYGIRLSPYYVMARQALQAVVCRVGFEDVDKWFSGHSWDEVETWSSILIVGSVLLISLPLAFFTSLRNLKGYARTLFVLTILVYLLILISFITVESEDIKDPPKMTGECVTKL